MKFLSPRFSRGTHDDQGNMRSSLRLVLALALAASPPPTALLVNAWDATWESLDSRPLPPWYDEAKFGIFVHWGVFSVPSFGSETKSAEWFLERWLLEKHPEYVSYVESTEPPKFAYEEYARRFDATLYDPNVWSDLFAESGAQYVVFTAKHHDGYCNWDSRDAVPSSWNWNAVDVGPRRDILGELAKSVKGRTSPTTGKPLKWGLYHSLYEWVNPAYLSDRDSGWTRTVYRDGKVMPALYDLVNKHEPELIWSDGDRAPDAYWNAPEFLSWYATHSPVADTAVWNDRWGNGNRCVHGSYLTCHDRYQPGGLQSKKWENAYTIDAHSWGLNRNSPYSNYKSTNDLVHKLVETVAYGGNLLLNVGPAADGTIGPIFFDRLLGMGEWLKVNGDAIYSTVPWKVAQNETSAGAFYTHKPSSGTVYALVTKWPKNDELVLEAPKTSPDTEVRMLGLPTGTVLPWKEGMGERMSLGGGDRSGMIITVPALTPDVIPCQHAWVFAITGLADRDDAEANAAS